MIVIDEEREGEGKSVRREIKGDNEKNHKISTDPAWQQTHVRLTDINEYNKSFVNNIKPYLLAHFLHFIFQLLNNRETADYLQES